MKSPDCQLITYGEAGLCVQFNAEPSVKLSAYIQYLAAHLRRHVARLHGVVTGEVIPAYQSLTLYYPDVESQQLKETTERALSSLVLPERHTSTRTVEIPVCYAEQYAPDLPQVVEYTGLSRAEVIKRHTASTYQVHMLGFLPGFLYLGGLHDSLHCPRKTTPELTIQPGAVGIGGTQTGVYPVASPGGWQIIGQTPLKMFQPHSEQPFIAQPLDNIRFVAIDDAEFSRLSQA